MSARARQLLLVLAAVLVVGLLWWARTPDPGGSSAGEPVGPPTASANTFLPPEALAVLDAIRAGGPFDYDRDGITFGNREGLLPQREHGYYREYTVPTPGEDDRGARRIVTGGDPVEVAWYTADHYQSFTRIEDYP